MGPGKGALTKYLLEKDHFDLLTIDADSDMVGFLKDNFPEHDQKFIFGNFLKADFYSLFNGQDFQIVGNFPYNISSQIVFKIIENKELVPVMTGMFQKELAERIVAPEGSKTYGVISVLTQAYYETTMLFHVSPGSFNPPPKVTSSVIQLKRKDEELSCDPRLFKIIVKQSFGQRRKMLRNTLRSLVTEEGLLSEPIFSKRPEALSLQEFIDLTNKIEKQKYES